MNIIKTITFLLCATLGLSQTVPIRNPQIQGASGSIISGATLTNSGTFVNSGTMNGAGTFDLSSGTVTLPASSVTSGNITDGAIVNADINASAAIDITKLASSAITIAGTSTSLGGSITASAILDSISSTQGTILYRGASGWAALSPGTSGHFLKTQGAGANPMWDAAAGSGSVATDAIWDAAGDLVVGTGANTAARLAIGTSGYVLTSNGTTATWAAPTGGTFSTLSDVDLTGIATGDFLKWNGTDWINRTAVNVRTDLGLVIGTNVQAYDADLTTYAGITPSANVQSLLGSANYAAMRALLDLEPSVDYMPYTLSLADLHTLSGSPAGSLPMTNGLGGYTGIAASANVQSLLGAADYSAMRTQLSLVPGTNVQAYDATLAALAALNNTKGVLAQTGSDTFTRLQTPVNVKVYGAAGDARKVTDAVLNGTTTVTSATAAFTSADTGKVVWGIETSSGAARLPVGTATYVNSTTITCSVSATGSYTGIHLVIGTDDTAEIQAAATAADAMSPKGQVYIPGGGYVFSDRLFNQTYASGTPTYSIQGDGSFETILYPSPDHAASGGVILNTNSNATHGNMVGLQIDGSSASFTGVSFVSEATNKCLWIDMRLTNFKGISNITRVTSSDSRFYNCHWEGSNYVGVLVTGFADFYGCYTGNHGFYGLHLNGGRAHWFGGLIDESGTASVQNDVGVFKVSNSIVYAGENYISTVLTGASLLYADNTEFVPFSSNNNCTGLSLAATSNAWVTNCKFTGSGTGYGINNSGTVHDGGGNTVGSLTGTVLADGANSIRSVANGGTGASSLTNLITLTTHTTGNYVADVAGTSNEITSTHTPGEGSTATLSLPATIDLGGKTSFEIPNGAAPTVDATGEIAGDNDLWAASRGAPVFFDGTAATALVNVLVSDTPSNGQVPVWNTGGTITWETNGSGSVATDTIWDAKGDLAGGTGSNTAARLPVGTNGYVLTADSAETTGMKWAAASGGSGNWVLVSTTTISGTPATIDFDVSTGYRRYRLELDSVICGGDGYVLYMRTSTDGGSTYDSGASDYNSGHGPSATYLPTQVTSAQIETGAIIGADAGEGWSGEIDIYEPGATTNRPFCQWSLFGPHYSSGAYNILTGGARRATAADIDHVRLLFQSANTFLSGKIRLFRWSE